MITSKYYEQLPTPFRFQLIHVLRPIMGARKCGKQFGRVIKTLYISNIWKLMNSTARQNATEKLMNFRWNHLDCTPRLAHVLYFLLLELDKKAVKLQLT